jgi:hypothetical protein
MDKYPKPNPNDTPTPGGDDPREPTMPSVDILKALVISDARELNSDALTDKEIVKKVKTDIPNLTCILK